MDTPGGLTSALDGPADPGISKGRLDLSGLYRLGRTLGRGHFAVVKLGRHVNTGQLVAVKMIDKTKLDVMAASHLLQEVRCMRLVQHPNVVRLYEVIDTPTTLYLVMELAEGGDLYDYILRHERGVAEVTAKRHFAQIVRAVAHCHQLHVVHRDLKPENVVFFPQQGAVKLTDFGFSNLFQPGMMLATSCGSLAYSAPEILLGEEYDAPAVDIWSLGVILYMLVCGVPPFQETNDSETLVMILDCRYSVPEHVSGECRDLISRMLQKDPTRRASLDDIGAHQWLQGLEDALLSPEAPPHWISGALTAGSPSSGAPECGDLLAKRTSTQQAFTGPWQPSVSFSLRPAPVEEPPVSKNLPALQQISEEEEEEELLLLSEEEMNKLGSKLIKAEMMGNTAMIEKLKSQLEAAHKAKENHAARIKQHETAESKKAAGHSSEDQEVLLFRTDQSGRAWPVKGPSGPQEPHGGRRKKKPMETHVDGQRVRYFQDDDSIGLQEMVRREKMSSAQDQHALYSRMAAKMMGKTDGDNYTLDDMFVSSAAQREGEGREEERMRSKAIAESRRLAASMDKCQHCFNSQDLQKHLIVAIGSKVYLSLPAGVSMAEGQCLICPLQHHCSATGLDEDIWSEMQLFRRALVRMFEAQELDCVFMETHINPRRRQHMVLECIPLPRELGDMAPIYFKKAIMECDEEWAMNKKIVDLSSKDIRRAVPRGLPYFAVDFGLQGGFAHVIENEQKFPHYFGKEVVGGMMDLEPRRWRKPIRENFDDQRKKVLQFAQWWKPYDCTKTQD
uniref:CWF19-like protein 2 n=1 Tax=Nothobranchius korthausae TaxID=1143690 RepID=A0A1A8HJ26_9TELE